MKPRKSHATGDATEEVSALIETLHETGQRLEELTAGEVDTVADRAGRTFLLPRAQEQLRLSEAARQAAILNALPAQIALLDTHGLIISVNEAWRRFGSANVIQGPGHGIGLNYLKICESAPGDGSSGARQIAAGTRSVLGGGVKSFSIEFPFHSPTEQRWFLLTVTPLADDCPNGAVVMVHDVTERKLAEEKVKRLNRVYAVLSGINTLIVRVHDRRELFNEACRIAVEDGQFPFAWIGALDPATQDVTPVAWAGESADELTRAKSSARDDLPAGRGAVGRAIRERRPVFNNDVIASSFGGPREKEILKLGFRSQLTLPLFEGQAVVGTLTMYAREPNFFDEEELRLLTELAGDISFALENISRQQKLDKLARIRAVSSEINAAIIRVHDREALLSEACRVAVEHGKFELVWIAALDHEKQEVQPVAWTGFSPDAAHAVNWSSIKASGGTLREAILTRAPVVRNDIEAQLPVGKLRQEALQNGCLSTVCLPLVVDDNVVALIALFAPGVGFFDEEELTLLNEVAGNISFALEHISRQQKLDKLARIRAVSGEINAAIVRIHDREALLRETCRIAVEHGKFELVWIALIDQEKQRIQPVAWAGFSSEIAHGLTWAGLSGPGGTVAEVIRTRKVAVRNDIDPELPAGNLRREAMKKGHRSTVCVPFMVEDSVVAAIILFAPGREFFDDEELALLNEVAADVSFALQGIEKQEKLEYLSYYDALTGLPNRTLFVDRLSQQMRSRGGEQQMVALILIDLERFRNINESVGHRGGDAVLKMIAQRLGDAFRGKDYLARISSNGFGVIVRGMKDAASVAHLVENEIFSCFEQPFVLADRELRTAAKAGIAMFPVDGESADVLFRNAESALQRVKASSQRLLFYAADMNAQAAQAMALETRLRKAVDARQFVLHYQPKIELATGRICGLEALIRWNDPASGPVPPVEFIPILEETGMILEVGRWVVEQAFADLKAWSERGISVPRIAVNVSAIQLQSGGFVEAMTEEIRRGGDRPECLELEITESVVMRDVGDNTRKLSTLRDLGVTVAIDDFGTGYSSLSYLSRLPLDSLKIDRSFISGMTLDGEAVPIVSTIIALAHGLNLKVVAEGVETEEQSNMLKLLRCDEAQGYLFSRPLPPERMEVLLRERSAPKPS